MTTNKKSFVIRTLSVTAFIVFIMQVLAVYAPVPAAIRNEPASFSFTVSNADTTRHFAFMGNDTRFIKAIEKFSLKKLVPHETVTWSTKDLILWQLQADDSHLLRKKADFIRGYSNVLMTAAAEFDLPPVLVAGIAWREFGGDPMWIDDIAYTVREFDHSGDPYWEGFTVTTNPLGTSFGNVSIQIRRAATALGFDAETLTPDQLAVIVNVLKDPVSNIFIAAKHIADLRDVDFYGRPAESLTTDELIILATRYNRGPELTLKEIKADTSYGNNIFRRTKLLTQLLQTADPTHIPVASIVTAGN